MPSRHIQRAVAAGFAGWAVARIAAADQFPIAEPTAAPVLAFTPQVAAAAWTAAALLRDKRARAVTAGAAGALTLVLAGRALPRRQPLPDGPALRVLTANLYRGQARPADVIRLVRLTRADVLFVQELRECTAAGLACEGLGDLLPHSVTDLGATDPRGNAIFARYPLARDPAPAPRWAQPVATLALPGTVARLVCVHLNVPGSPWNNGGYAAHWRTQLSGLPAPDVAGEPPGCPAPVVLAGDFNATVDHAQFRRLLRRGLADAALATGKGLVPTWGRPAALAIDHVLVDERCAVLACTVHRLPGSDHRAVFAEIQLNLAATGR